MGGVTVLYRRASLIDCEKVYSLICELEERELPFERFQGIFREQLSSKNWYCLIAEKDGCLLAVLNLRFEAQLHHSEYIAEIVEFVVKSDCRGQRIGMDMLAKAEQIAKQHGCAQIEAACNQRRTDSHRFYMREGMKNSHYKFSKRLIKDS